MANGLWPFALPRPDALSPSDAAYARLFRDKGSLPDRTDRPFVSAYTNT